MDDGNNVICIPQCITAIFFESFLSIHPQLGSTAEALSLLWTAPGHRPLQSLSCKCDFNFPATQHRANPPTDQIMSPCPHHLASSVMMSYEVLSKPPSLSGKLQVFTSQFSTASSMCVITCCSVGSVDFLGL